MTQLALTPKGTPVEIDLGEIQRQPTGSGAVALCASKSGLLDKVIAADIGAQESVWSRVKKGDNSLSLEQLDALMTRCGNEAPLFWLLLRRNYDPRSLRRLEDDKDREIRELREENERLRHERAIEMRLLREWKNA